MTSMCKDVADFHELILKDHGESYPSLISLDYCVERIRFLKEELDEFATAAGAANIVGISDALADLVYVALGTAYKMGLPFDDIWAAVHEANMRKVSGMTKRGNRVDAMKPTGWVGPEAAIARAIMRKAEDAPQS
jgi:predicted HAD superfamily Cof-like phosphohydrolase